MELKYGFMKKMTQMLQKFKIVHKEIYKFRVGVKGLFDNHKLENYDLTHAAFLIGTDLFEYGTQKNAMLAQC